MLLKNRNFQISLVVILISYIGIGYVFSTILYAPIQAEMKKSEDTIRDMQQKLNAAKARAQQLSKVQEEMASLQLEVADLEKQLPKNRELPSLIRTFTHRAETYGITLSSLSPGRAVSKGLYDEIPYAVNISASFHSLGRFLTAMGKGERLFAARNVNFTLLSTKNDPTKTVSVNFTLIAFKFHG